MNAATTATRTVLIVGDKEVIFTPYVIRKGKTYEAIDITIDGKESEAILNAHRGLTYFSLEGVTGRVAYVLEDGGVYTTKAKSARVTPPKAKRAPKVEAPAAEEPKVEEPKIEEPKAKPARVRKPKAATATV
jgi:hypothetical protein